MAQLDDLAPVDAPVEETVVETGEVTVEYNDEQEELAEEEEVAAEVVDESPPIEPPVSLDAKAKELFAKLDREAQEVLGSRISEQDRKIRDVGTELSQARDRAASEAHKVITERFEETASVLEQYAEYIVPQTPDARLLYSNDPNDVAYYQRAKYEYDNALAQREQAHLQAQELRQKATDASRLQATNEATIAWRQASQDNPDWFDPSTLNLKSEIQTKIEFIGQELGIPINLSEAFTNNGVGYAELDSSDIKAITVCMTKFEKADKWDEYQSNKMAGVRAGKAAPKLTQPSAAGKPQGEKSALDLLYPDD